MKQVSMRQLISIVVAVTNQTPDELKLHTEAALNAGTTPAAIKEAVYHCAPYIGLSKVAKALDIVNAAFTENNIAQTVESQSTASEETRLADGLKAQKSIFGQHIDEMRANAPENQKHIQEYLSAYCFGDFYTRNGLNLKERELLTFCILCAQGGYENQVRAHVGGNVNVGNDKETLLAALTQCIPYIGFSRTLNALAYINEVIPK